MQDSENAIELDDVSQAFIQHFGEMGSRWGINRTVGQMYALLVISEQPLSADQLAETLHLSRSNVSMGIKELNAWNLLRTVPRSGDRKTYFTTPEDVWEIARTLIAEKRKREIDPTLSMMRNALMGESAPGTSQYALSRIRDMHDLIELLVDWSDEMQTLQSTRLKQLFKLGSSVNKVLDLTDKVTRKK
ncbi:MAG: GbsR/MarR family transcriptional regulator [Pseudomonadota bacterium]